MRERYHEYHKPTVGKSAGPPEDHAKSEGFGVGKAGAVLDTPLHEHYRVGSVIYRFMASTT
jgi:hypothetical protein